MSLTTGLLILALASPPPDSLESPCLGGTVVTRADLEAASALHVHEVLRIAGLAGISVDGFDAEPISPVAPFAEPVRVLLDGMPVALGASPESPGLEAMPVALGEIERVVVCPGDGLAAGAFGGPWIDIQTTPPAQRAYGALGLGNETGDPGPDVYLDPTLPNVDHWGPDTEAAAGFRARAGTAWLSGRRRAFMPTDPAFYDRVTAASTRYPRRVGTVAALTLRRARVRARAAARRFDDLPYIALAESEVPLDHRSVQAVIAGRRTWGRLRVQGHAHAAHLRLDRPDWSRLLLDPDWAETRLDAALAVGASTGATSWTVGGRLQHVGATSAGFDKTATVGRLWAEASRGRATASGTGLASVVVADGALGGGVRLGGRWSGRALRVETSASLRRALAAEQPDLTFWAGRGYTAFGTVAGETGPTDLARLDVVMATRLGSVGLEARAEGIGMDGRIVLARADTLVVVEAAGTAARARVGAEWAGRLVRLRLWGRVQGALTGAGGHRETWRRLPIGDAALDATFRPDDRLALWARLGARTGTHWDGFPTPDLPATVLLDLGLSKRVLGEHGRLSLGGRNVLGATEQTHPLGATLAPRLFVRVEARL